MNENQKNAIQSQMLELSKGTFNTATEIIKKIDAYLSSFNKYSAFSFSRDDSVNCEEKHMIFLSSITNEISVLTSLNASLASLIIKADKAALIEPTLLMQKRFDAFCLFEKSLYNYTCEIEKALTSKKISSTFIIASTRKFKSATENLLQENS